MTNSYVAVDLETTGIGAKKEKITEIGMARVVNGVVTETYQTLVNPGREISEEITKLTGITNEMVRGAPRIEEVIGSAVEFCEGFPLLGHQIIFDYGFLKQAAVNHGITFERKGIDTLKLCRLLMPAEEKKNLGAACHYFGIDTDGAHRALADAQAAHFLYQELKKRFADGKEELFFEKDLNYTAKKAKAATKRQKEHLQDLIKYHRISLSVELDHMSGNEMSRQIDKIISQHGKIPKNG